MSKQPTFVGFTEEMIEDTVSTLVDDITAAIDDLMPDGRPFGVEPMTDKEKVALYVAQFRGSPDAWANLIRTQVAQAGQRLSMSGLPPDKLTEAHLYNAVIARAIVYSKEMEDLVRQAATSGMSAEAEVPDYAAST